MSPQRMAIASLLCPDDQPRPAHEPGRVRHAEKPRTIDALLHPAPVPASAPATTTTTTTTTTALSTPGPSLSQHRAMSSSSFYVSSPTDSIRHSFPSPRYSPLHSARAPFAGLQALVHVASEEHRRISTLDREREHHHYNPRHPDVVGVDYHHHHRPHKRARTSRSASPSPTTDTLLPATPPPFESQQRGRSASTSGGSQRGRPPPPDLQYYSRSYVHLVHPTSRVAHPSTLSPLMSHSQHSPLLLSHTLPSPSRHSHSFQPQPQTPPPQPTRHLPLHRDCGTSTPRMAGGISLLREDPRVETSRHQEHRTTLEQDLPYLQVQAHLPVQSPIPRLPSAAWDVRKDTPPKEQTLSSTRANKPALTQRPPWVTHLPTQSPVLDSPPQPAGQTGFPLMQQQSVHYEPPMEQATSLLCAREISAQLSASNSNIHSVDQSTSKTQPEQRWPTPRPESPRSTPSLPEERSAGNTPSPLEILATSPPISPVPPPRESPPIASVPVSLHSEEAVPEPTLSHSSSTRSPCPTPSPSSHTIQHEPHQGTDGERAPAHEPEAAPSQILAPVKIEKVEEEPAPAVDDSVQTPRPQLELVLKADPPVMQAVPPVTQHSEPDLGVKLERDGAGDPQVTQPVASPSSSPTPSTCIKAEAHPEVDNADTLLPISSPPEVDYKSADTVEGSYDVVGMDIDVDEELLSLVEDRPPARRAQPRSGEDREQGRLASRAFATLVDEELELDSVPLPNQRKKKGERGVSVTTAKKKKQETASKPPAKPKQPPKSRTKPTAKTKAKLGVEEPKDTSKSTPKPAGVSARSRSTSVLLVNDSKEDNTPAGEVEESDKEDDKLYCVCKTGYDEDRVMIACDRCDEWYHTQCVNMPDLEIDLVDQFTCPPCVKKNPELHTTWKRRCLYGVRHENPSSPSACHKPSRGAFSKYCSDGCGIKYMQLRISQWESDGGKRDALWEAVKHAEKREGVVVRVDENNGKVSTSGEVVVNGTRKSFIEAPSKRRVEWEIGQLNARLEEVVKQREMVKLEMDMVLWREKLVHLAAQRAEKVDECGWDQRLCFGKEEWSDFGAEVLDSYEEKAEHENDAMHVDDTSSNHGEWWCAGKKKCERHAGWQKLRIVEVSFEKETKEGVLVKLTTCEREIRKRIEDILYPRAHSTSQKAPVPLSPGLRLNGTHNS